MENVAVIAGQTITVGAVATLLAQWLKGKEWFPQSALLIRVSVALVCVLVSGLSSLTQGAPISLETLLAAFFSYTVAATAYDHLWKA